MLTKAIILKEVLDLYRLKMGMVVMALIVAKSALNGNEGVSQ